MIKKLLIANRGEIACRIMRTARRMGIQTIAVYSDADAGAMHVREADQAVNIGPAEALKSYLNSDAILGAAKETGADSIHPGYGFFSENADFADAVRSSGMVFVGPPSQAIRDMGAKDNAKAIMETADVPIVPGYFGADQSIALFKDECEKIGYPVLLKAALGGGGKGMRVVNASRDLGQGIAAAKRESMAAFGDDRLLIEKYLTNTRHVEVQIFADGHGNCIHLFERDCSLQRRHQKVIEEAPAPGLSDDVRKRMGDAAVRAAKAVRYEGAGTIEFLLADDGHFYFMEMNTRLQVEHPVSELITGTDLVEWQLRVASGEPLMMTQDEVLCSGHAIEARLYAEDPSNEFMPAPGPLHHLVWPEPRDGLRIDTGVAEGDVISPHYDPMIAKVICWGETREDARQKLSACLGELQIIGPGSNATFLRFLLEHPVFQNATMATSFIDGLDSNTYAKPLAPPRAALVAAAEFVVAKSGLQSENRAKNSNDPYSPWNQSHCWRLNDTGHQDLTFIYSASASDSALSCTVSIFHETDGYAYIVNGENTELETLSLINNAAVIEATDNTLTIFGLGHPIDLSLYDSISAAEEHQDSNISFAAPMPGRVSAITVKEGDMVEKGDTLIVVEAMKMEHAIIALYNGVIGQVLCEVGSQVDEGQELLKMDD